MDATLVALAQAAEAGRQCPVIKFLSGNHFYFGTPAPEQAFVDALEKAAVSGARKGLAQRPRSERKLDAGDPDALAATIVDPLRGVLIEGLPYSLK
jgi:hypothetical protein